MATYIGFGIRKHTEEAFETAIEAGLVERGGYTNAKLDKLLADGRQTFEHQARKAIYNEVQEIIAADAALIPVFHVSQVNVGRPGLTGFSVHPTETYWITHKVSILE